MFAAERMRKVTVIGPQSVMGKAVRELYRIRAMHISASEKGELDIGSPFDSAERLSGILVAIRSVSSALGVSGKKELSNGFRAVGLKSLGELERAVKKLNAEVNDLLSKKKDTEEELKRVEAAHFQLRQLQRLGLGPDDFSGYRSLSCFAGFVNDPDGLKKSLLAITDRFELYASNDKAAPIIALFIDAAKRNEAADALSKAGFSELQISGIKSMSGKTGGILESLDGQRARLAKNADSASRSLARLGSKWNDFLLLGEQIIASELEKAEAPLMFGVSRKAFVIDGWVPVSLLSSLEHTLSKATGERIYVESCPPHHGESVPVRMDNPKPAKPFEFFMKLYALPKYDEIDPTVFTLVTFPLFFGFILGDVGYGLVSFFLLLWLKEKMPGAGRLVNVLIPAVVSSIVFGFMFGEIFGFEQAFGMEFPRLIGRAHAVNEMMVMAVVVGLAHINLGFVLGFFNELRHHGFFRAFAAKLSWIFLELSVALAALSFMHVLRVSVFIPVAAAIFFVALITKAEGFRGPIEIPGLLSNLMSYSRLAAVGLSSVILAVVVNDLAREIARAGPLGVVFAVFVLFTGHAINLALGLLGGFLHSMRLHYVEFFTKFFEGGAIQFKPFGSKQE